MEDDDMFSIFQEEQTVRPPRASIIRKHSSGESLPGLVSNFQGESHQIIHQEMDPVVSPPSIYENEHGSPSSSPSSPSPASQTHSVIVKPASRNATKEIFNCADLDKDLARQSNSNDNTAAEDFSFGIPAKKKPRTSQVSTFEEKTNIEVPNIFVEQISEGSGFRHQVAYPASMDHQIDIQEDVYPVLPSSHDFNLDPFQIRATACVDVNQSVLVSAHTSSGKTIVAEYAVQKAFKDHRKVIYTTPIKALSNQKYREFSEKFKDVGLITGEVTINSNAHCMIMTTEILRNILYRGSQLLQGVGWIVFDEVHYMREKTRGVIWEECLILLPREIHCVFLSATIPNAVEFSQWIAHIHQQPCHVIQTDNRPIPLSHYIFPIGGNGIHLVVDDMGDFRQDGFQKAMECVVGGPNTTRTRLLCEKDFGDPRKSPYYAVIKMIIEKGLSPLIVFTFSKTDCEMIAALVGNMDMNMNSVEDKELIEEVFVNAIEILSEEEKTLPQVQSLLPLLKNGIGMHHGGMLPLLKEVVEVLFAEGMINVLCATETFSMGMNMPARSVLLTSVRKFDGNEYRWLTSGEYIQMSGRAGRRGIDEQGSSIVMINEKFDSNIGRSLLKGQAWSIKSSFHLTYNMILNLIRVEDINPKFMLERSFKQFQALMKIPVLKSKLETAVAEYDSIQIPCEEKVENFHHLKNELQSIERSLLSFITKPCYILPFIVPGRLIYVKNGKHDFGWSCVINCRTFGGSDSSYIIGVLMRVATFKLTTNNINPVRVGEKGEIDFVPISLNAIHKISDVVIAFPKNKDPTTAEVRERIFSLIEKKFPDSVLPLLDPVLDMKITDKDFEGLLNRKTMVEKQLADSPFSPSSPETKIVYDLYERKSLLKETIDATNQNLRESTCLIQVEELKSRMSVLEYLGFVSPDDDVLTLKGRVACHICSGDELLLTEMIFRGVFVELDIPLTVALLSCVVCDETDKKQSPKLGEELDKAFTKLQDIATEIATISIGCKLNIETTAYVNQFKPTLMGLVYDWCNGASFLDISKETDIYEGDIVRCMKRLEELLKECILAANIIRTRELENKFTEGLKLLRKGIVFAPSLYA